MAAWVAAVESFPPEHRAMCTASLSLTALTSVGRHGGVGLEERAVSDALPSWGEAEVGRVVLLKVEGTALVAREAVVAHRADGEDNLGPPTAVAAALSWHGEHPRFPRANRSAAATRIRGRDGFVSEYRRYIGR
jgi:hypothetical protein